MAAVNQRHMCTVLRKIARGRRTRRTCADHDGIQ
jgi:hypothetical protein